MAAEVSNHDSVNMEDVGTSNLIGPAGNYTIDFLAQGIKYGGCREDELRLYRYKLKRAKENKLINFRSY